MKIFKASATFLPLLLLGHAAVVAGSASVVQPNFSPGASGVESINGFTINGVPTLFYQGFLPAQKPNWTVYESQFVNGAWTTSVIASNPYLAFSGATVVNGTPYVGYVVAGSWPNGMCTATVLSQSSNGSWTTEYTSPTPSDHLGINIAMGVYNNEPVAVFDGPYPASGYYSPNAVLLEKTASSGWQTTTVPVQNNAGFFHFSPVQVGNNLSFLGTTYGGFGDLLMTRTGGYGASWSGQFFSQFQQDTAGNLTNVGGNLTFLSSGAYNTISGSSVSSLPLQAGGSVVGSDLEVINGVPTLAFLDRQDNKLHVEQLINGTLTNDQVLASGMADWPQAVSVFAGPDGSVAVAAVIAQGSTTQVEYFGSLQPTPEPASLTLLLLSMTAMLMKREPNGNRRYPNGRRR